MNTHAHTTTPTPIARRRAARPGGGVLDRRVPSRSLPASTRARIERDIDRLIALLDSLDAPFQDLEEVNEDCCRAEDWPLPNCVTSRECEDAEDGGDDEPWLGWTNLTANLAPSQTAGTDDLEKGEDAEPDADNEPVCFPHTPDGGLLGGVRNPGNPLIVMTLGDGGPVTWSGRGHECRSMTALVSARPRRRRAAVHVNNVVRLGGAEWATSVSAKLLSPNSAEVLTFTPRPKLPDEERLERLALLVWLAAEFSLTHNEILSFFGGRKAT